MKQTDLNKIHSFRQAIPNKIYTNERGETFIGTSEGRLKRYTQTQPANNVTNTSTTVINNLDSPHASTHEDGGTDEIDVTGLSGELADAQKITIRKNSGSDVGTRKRINFIEGKGIVLTILDDGVDDEVDLTVFKKDIYATTVTEVSGTATAAEELLYAFTITGGDCVNLDTIIVRALLTFASTSGSQKVFRIRVDTSATGVTGTIVAEFQSNNSSGSTIPLKIWQDIKCKSNGGNTLETAYISSGSFTQGVLSIISTANINLANNWYIKITSDKAVSGDTTTLKYADVQILKN